MAAPKPALKHDITPKQIEQIKEIASKGMTQEQIYRILGIGKTKWYELVKENEELSNAIKIGKAKGHYEVATTLFEVAVREKNVAALIFLSKTQMGWSDNKKPEIDEDSKTITQEQLEAFFKELPLEKQLQFMSGIVQRINKQATTEGANDQRTGVTDP